MPHRSWDWWDWWGWWEAEEEKPDGKLPELGLNSGPEALSKGHNHYTTQPPIQHTHTHTLYIIKCYHRNDVILLSE